MLKKKIENGIEYVLVNDYYVPINNLKNRVDEIIKCEVIYK